MCVNSPKLSEPRTWGLIIAAFAFTATLAPAAIAQPEGQPDAAAADSQPAADQDALDIDALRREYLKLRDELFRSRARAAAVASQLYSTKLQVYLNYATPRFYTVTRATVRLDGGNVYDDADGAIATDRAPRFEGFVAPGRHVIAIRIEAVGKDDERFETTIENSFSIQAPAGTDVTVTASARDDGDIAFAWGKKQRGSYKLRMDVSVTTAKRPGPAPADDAGGAAPADDAGDAPSGEKAARPASQTPRTRRAAGAAPARRTTARTESARRAAR